MYKRFLKRFTDIFISLTGLMILSPVIIVVFIILYLSNRAFPLFIQSRPGEKERIFKLVKFKTMNDNVDENGNLLPDDQRLTTTGRLVRKLSLDELPQLLNVLKGDMSIVGPRPLLVDYLPLYNKEQKRRHDIKPGITGWAQVNGRNSITWQEKFQHDIWYVDHLSFLLDLKIIALTIKKVFKTGDVNSSEKITMIKFTGNN
jgi:lipopolysaccharide/colanic/teichoic acid biosynthesis glycosyltransferase